MQVIKATGKNEQFSEEKVRASIQRAGIPEDLQQEVITHVTSKLYENIPTSEIYHHISEFLGTSSHPHAKAKYGLKQAIAQLGPTGYPFEDFVAEILKTQGYQTTVRNMLMGKCITHEIDVIAQKGKERLMVEAKFHNLPGTKTSIHVALYTKARFNDVLEKNNLNLAWLITNTKMSQDAITYAICMGMRITSWDYPDGESLRDLIEKSGLSPITVLTTLSNNQKQILLEKSHVLCKTLYTSPQILDTLSISTDEKKKILDEAKFVCNLSL